MAPTKEVEPVDIPQHALLTPAETMDVLRISASTLKRWRRARILTFVKRGRRILFPRTAIEAYVRSHTVMGAAG